MRVLLILFLLLVTGLAGCLDGDADPDDPTEQQGGDEDGMDQFPERRFEPRIILQPEAQEVQPESTIDFTFDITDLHDYDFPLTFIDWAVFYERDPTPVAEGDATQLPGAWNRTVYAVDYHMVGFRADDGQGFKDYRVFIVQVGEPEESAYPNATEIQGFKDRMEEYFQEPEEEEGPPEPVCVAICDGLSEEVDTAASCFASCQVINADGCVGWGEATNGVDCAWMALPPEAAGAHFTVRTTGALEDPDGAFYSACAPDAEHVSTFASGGYEEGTVPEGAGCIWAFEYTGDPVTMTFTVDPIFVVPE